MFLCFRQFLLTLIILSSFARSIEAERVQIDHFLEGAWAFNSDFPSRNSIMSMPAYCSHYVLEKGSLSDGAKIFDEQGWPILADISLARWQFFVIAQEILPGTSGLCSALGGKLVIYYGETFLGFIAADNADAGSIGGLELLEGSGVRLYSGNSLFLPLADLILTNGHQLLLKSPSLLTSHCQGKVIFPSIYGMDIKDARDDLIELGWKPKFPDNLKGEMVGPTELELIDLGFPEVVTCSGTGYGRCIFEYDTLEVAELEIITWGDTETLIVAKHIRCFGNPVSLARSPNIF